MVLGVLAQSVQLALIELFVVHQALPEPQHPETMRESHANCSFHLRTLAKYGFVEEAGGGRGRERPWRASTKSLRIRLRSADLANQQARVAAGAGEAGWYERW